MADGDTALLTERPETGGSLPSGLVAGLQNFAEDHDGAKAIIEYVGRRGARIVLVADDGAWGDEFAPGTDVARQACATVGIPIENTWERELTSQMGPTSHRWRAMGRRSLAR